MQPLEGTLHVRRSAALPQGPTYVPQPSVPLFSIVSFANEIASSLSAPRNDRNFRFADTLLEGIIAFEIAQQLTLAGRQVALLALFGCRSPAAMSFSHRAHVLARHSARRVIDLVKTLWRLSLQGKIHYLLDKVKQRQREKEKLATVLLHHPYRPQIEQATEKAVQRYRPEIYSGRITLFLPTQNPTKLRDGRHLEWKNWTVNRFESEAGPPGCTVKTMLREPYVKTFAELLRTRLDRIKVERSP